MESITSFSKSIWGFSPQSIPGLALWLDAQNPNSYTKTGTTLNSIQDISGSGTTFSGTTGSTIGSTLFNSKYPSFYTTSSSSILGISGTNTFSLPQPFTVFMIGQVSTGGTLFSAIGTTPLEGTSIPLTVYTSGTSNLTTMRASTTGLYPIQNNNQAGNLTVTNPFISCITFNSSSSTIYNNGTLATSGSLGTQGFYTGTNQAVLITSISGNGTTVTVNFASTSIFIGVTSISVYFPSAAGSGGTAYNGTFTITAPVGAVTSLTYTSTATGTPSTYANSGVGIPSGFYQCGTLQVGGTGSNATIGHLCELIFYSGALTINQIQLIEGYLAWKWGLQANLPATHPYNSSLGVMPFSRSFIPPDIGSCNLWLDGKDASTITLSGSSVTQWNDKSGNGYNAVGTAGSYPTYNSTTGALTFNSSFLNVASSTLTTSTTQSGFFVASITSPASSGSINTVIGPSPGSVGGLQIRFDSSFMRFSNAGITSYVTSTLTTPNATTSAGLTQLFGYVMSAGATSPYQNGVALSTGTVATLGGSNHVMLGARGTIGSTIEYLTGTICEVVLYSTALSTTQRQQIEGYLIWKWGLQRGGYYPSTAPFYKYPSASTTFNPLQISGLTLWLDAADSTTITTSGSNVTGWNDKSGNARNCTISGTPTLLTSSLNGLNGIQFYNTTSANTNAWTSPSFAISSTNSISAFVVGNSTPVNPGNIYFISAGTSAPSTPNNNLSMLINTSTSAYRLYINGSTYSSTAFTNTNGVTNLYEVTYNNATETPYVNGTVYVTNGGSGTGLASSQYIGSYTGTGGATLKEYEILLFNVSLTTQQRQVVEGYLSWKWGLRANLPTTHPYYNVKP
jgi:hypothetical protein